MKTLLACLLLLCFLTGCKLPGNTSTSGEKQGNSRGGNQLGGNGEAYSGIIKKYFDLVPNYTCTNDKGQVIPSYRSRLTVDPDGSISFGRDACNPNETKISRDDVDMSATKLVSEYESNLYQNFDNDPLDPQNTKTITWCKTDSIASTSSGYEFILGQKPTSAYVIGLYRVTNGVAGQPVIMAGSYQNGTGQRVIQSTDPSVSFKAVITFGNLTISAKGYTGQGTMEYPRGTVVPISCLFSITKSQ